ncbi:MAG: dihydrodipicolinate synthase family protein [Victivallaceae bacterium]|jgi:dihydrodipicolinate synthase/N-acetylneuraminate lyase
MKRLNRENIAGVWSAVPTPFTNELELDTEAVERLVEHQVRLGIKGLLLASPNGEGHAMSDSRRMELAKEVVKSNRDRMLLAMQIEDNPVKLMLDDIKRIEDCGIDIAVIGFPFTSIEIEQEYLKELYFSVIEKSSLPIALYHFNRVSPVPLFVEILLQPKVILIANCLNDPHKTAILLNIAKGRKNKLFTLSGHEANCVSPVKFGYDGVLLSTACFTGFIADGILKLAKEGETEDAVKVQYYMNSILVDVFGMDFEYFLAGQKQILVELGIFNTASTLLNEPFNNERITRIKEIVKEEKEFLLP